MTAKKRSCAQGKEKSVDGGALASERQRIARALHGTICQELTGFYLIASGAARQCRASCPDTAKKLDDLAGKIQRAGANLGTFVSQMRAGESESENRPSE